MGVFITVKNFFFSVFFSSLVAYSSSSFSAAQSGSALEIRLVKWLELLQYASEQTTDREALFLDSRGFEIEPFELLKQICSSFSDHESTKQHMPVFADLAEAYLRIAIERSLSSFCSNSEEVCADYEAIYNILINKDFSASETDFRIKMEPHALKSSRKPIFKTFDSDEKRQKKERAFQSVISDFWEEVQSARNEERATYRWFVIYCGQIALLISKMTSKSFALVSTDYSSYLVFALSNNEFPCFKEEFYLTQNEFHNRYLTIPGQLDFAPMILLFPYPFDISHEQFLDLVESINGEKRLIWPCGFSFRPVPADGWYHCSGMFFIHDPHHLGLILASMYSENYCIEDIQNFHESSIQSLINRKKIESFGANAASAFVLYCDLMEELRVLSSGNDTYQFFGFLVLHDFLINHFRRLTFFDARSSAGFGSKRFFSVFKKQSFFDENYYNGILPEEFKGLGNDELSKKLSAKFSDYCKRMSVMLSDELKAKISAYISKATSELPLCTHNLGSDLKFKIPQGAISPSFVWKGIRVCKDFFRFNCCVKDHEAGRVDIEMEVSDGVIEKFSDLLAP